MHRTDPYRNKYSRLHPDIALFSTRQKEYLIDLLSVRFKKAQLNRLTRDEIKALHRCAPTLLSLGYSPQTLARVAENKDTKLSLFNIARIHKTLRILNINTPISKTISSILFDKDKSPSHELNRTIHQIYCHAFPPENAIKLEPLTIIINRLLYCLGINEIFDADGESTFLNRFRMKGMGTIDKTQDIAFIFSQQHIFSANHNSFFPDLSALPPIIWHHSETEELLALLEERP